MIRVDVKPDLLYRLQHRTFLIFVLEVVLTGDDEAIFLIITPLAIKCGTCNDVILITVVAVIGNISLLFNIPLAW